MADKRANRMRLRKERRARNQINNDINKLVQAETGRATKMVKPTMERIHQNLKKIPRKNRKYVEERVITKLSQWVQQYVLLTESTPPLPSPFQEKVQNHNLIIDFPISLRYNTPDGFIAFMTQPSFEKFLRIAVPGTAQGTTSDDAEVDKTDHEVDIGRTPSNRLLCSDKSWTISAVGSGRSSELAPILANVGTNPPAFHWSNNKKTWIDGLKVYPIGSIISAPEPTIHFKSRFTDDVEVQCLFYIYDQGQAILAQLAGPWTVVVPDQGSDLPFVPVQWTSIIVPQFPATAYFAYGVQVRPIAPAPQVPQMGSGTHIEIRFELGPFVFGAPLLWEDFSVLDVTAGGGEDRIPLQAQYASASHIKFGLYDVTVQNATPNIAKGGLIASAQFPGGTRATSILRNPPTLFPYLATIPTMSSKSMLFDNGQHYFLRPEKLQDWMFKQIVVDDVLKNFLEHDVPKIVSAIYAPPAVGFTIPFVHLTGNVHYELLTYDRSAVQQCATGDSLNQIENLLNALRSIPQFTENPSHWKTLGNAIKSVVSSPMFRKLATDLGTMGLEMLAV